MYCPVDLYALCSPHLGNVSCEGPDRRFEQVEAVLPETFKKERTSAGGRIQEESLASKNKESQEKVSWMYRR
jgi:hypothetical protein